MSVNTKMTAIADPIRTLSGASGALTLDQMAQKLTAANEDVTSILAALTEKGVDTTGKGLADIAELVESIQVGGKPKLVTEIGTFTVAEKVWRVTVSHSLGLVPKVAIVSSQFSGTSLSGQGIDNAYLFGAVVDTGVQSKSGFAIGGVAYFGANKTYSTGLYNPMYDSTTGDNGKPMRNATSTDVTFDLGSYLFPGYTYEYLIAGVST